MKISRSSKRRAAGRIDQAVKEVHETCKNYRWWHFQETVPADGYILDHHTYHVPARPPVQKPSTRKPKHPHLSKRALRARLYRRQVPKAQWPKLLAEYAGRARFVEYGAPSLKHQWGYSVAKALERHVAVRFLVHDEFHQHVAPGFAEMARFARSFSFNTNVLPATQTLTPELQSMAAAVLGIPDDEASPPVRYNPLLDTQVPATE